MPRSAGIRRNSGLMTFKAPWTAPKLWTSTLEIPVCHRRSNGAMASHLIPHGAAGNS
ncbi:Uncharacterised protein [Mycobacteroides abscessus subsp. abscessus]|nr:Uncharacterised protein [Mycobacteroides abscessus subsp. abscessus]